MCGIFAYVSLNEHPATLVLDALKSLEYRGYDSWGVAVTSHARIQLKKQTGKIGTASVSELPSSTLGFGHTRWATHGGITAANAHPHLDCSGKIALVHNGIFENYETIKQDLLSKGHHFLSATDTEVAVHLIEEYAKHQSFPAAVRSAFLAMEGMNALIALHVGEQRLVAIRRGSPLVVGFNETENYLASDPAALLPYTRSVYFLEDNEMAIVESGRVRFSNLLTQAPVTVTPEQLTWNLSQTLKGNYPYFMLKEIHEQPAVLAHILSTHPTALPSLTSHLQQADNIYLLGCGTASYAAMAGSFLLSQIAHLHSHWAVASEFGPELKFVTPKSVLLALSQSGETMDLLEPLKAAKHQGAKVIALVNVLGSSLYRLADSSLLMGAGPEKSVATTKDFTAKLAYLLLLSYTLAGNPSEGKRLLSLALTSLNEVLSEDTLRLLQSLAHAQKHAAHLYVLGRGLSYPLSLEAALKIKEISYLHAEGLATGEIKHGPLALIEAGTPCLAFLPHDDTYVASLAGVMEMKARGAFIIGVSDQPHALFDAYIPVADARAATIIPQVVVAQLFAYYLTLERGLDPDMPRNLAKSVTVK